MKPRTMQFDMSHYFFEGSVPEEFYSSFLQNDTCFNTLYACLLKGYPMNGIKVRFKNEDFLISLQQLIHQYYDFFDTCELIPEVLQKRIEKIEQVSKVYNPKMFQEYADEYCFEANGEFHIYPLQELLNLPYLTESELENTSDITYKIYGYTCLMQEPEMKYCYLPDQVDYIFDQFIEKDKFNIKICGFQETTEFLPKYQNLFQNPFLQDILNSIPADLSKYEQALYAYFSLMLSLQYDERYIKADIKEKDFQRHVSPNYLNKISPQNNRVVCFEFMAFLYYLWKKLDIPVQLHMKQYGYGHAYLSFLADSFWIKADPISSAVKGDYFTLKFGQELRGLSCENQSYAIRREASIRLKNIYERFMKEHPDVLKGKEFWYNLEQQKTKFLEMDYITRLNSLLQILIQSPYEGNIFMNLLIHYFNYFELKNNYTISISRIKSSLPPFSLQMTYLISSPFDENIYIVYPNKKIQKVTKEMLDSYQASGKISIYSFGSQQEAKRGR